MIKKLANYLDELNDTENTVFWIIVFIVFIALLISLIIYGGTYESKDKKITRQFESFQECVTKNLDNEQKLVNSKYELMEYRPFDCNKFLNN